MADLTFVPSPYTFVSLTLCIDASQHVLLARESRPDCRGKYYVPAGRGQPGEDPIAIAHRTTLEKTGIIIEPTGIIGIEHNPPIGQYPGQIRTFLVARAMGGTLKVHEDEHSLDAVWMPYPVIKELKGLRNEDFLTWLDDAILGQPCLPASSWRALGNR